jgi:hypothetical protein
MSRADYMLHNASYLTATFINGVVGAEKCQPRFHKIKITARNRFQEPSVYRKLINHLGVLIARPICVYTKNTSTSTKFRVYPSVVQLGFDIVIYLEIRRELF